MSVSIGNAERTRLRKNMNKTLNAMTEKDISSKITIHWKGYGTYRVTITYRRKIYSCISHNSQAYDMRNWEKGEPRTYYNTRKQALMALYNECKRKNDL